MRVPRPSLTAIVVAILLGSLPTSGLAGWVEHPVPGGPAAVDGVCTLEAVVSPGTNERIRHEQYGMEDVVHDYRWEASDPRLSGDARGRATWFGWYAPEFVAVSVVSWTFVNEHGRWTGTATGLADQASTGVDAVTLTGHGGYAGLTAYLVFVWDEVPARFHGVIFEGSLPGPSTVEGSD